MDLDRCRYMVDDGRRWLSANGWQRAKLIGVSAVLAPLLIWIGVNVVSAMTPEPPGRPADTPAWNVAHELNAALVEHDAFADTSFVVESEDPLRLRLVGSVDYEEDLGDLEEFVAKLRPQKDYEMSVEVLGEITNAQPEVDGDPGPDDGEQPTDNG